MNNTGGREMENLIEERRELTWDLGDCEPGAFPGSEASRKEQQCLDAISRFDELHPEILAELKRRHAESHTPSDEWI